MTGKDTKLRQDISGGDWSRRYFVDKLNRLEVSLRSVLIFGFFYKWIFN